MSFIYNVLFLSLFSVTTFAGLPSDYVGLSRQEKLDILWDKISTVPYENLPGFSNRLLLQALGASAAFNLRPTIEHKSDLVPEGRIKFIHTYGSCAKVELVTVENSFTGLFQEGAIGIARLGWAAPPELVGFIPGMAVKFLIDKKLSVNIQVMNSLDGQGQNANFFAKTFSNSLEEPTQPLVRTLALLFKAVTENPFYLPVDHLAATQNDGLKIKSIVYPIDLVFEPRHVDWISSDARQDLREKLASFRTGSVLYDVYGITETEKIKIGVLKLKSRFINSSFCDQNLFFQHHTVETVGRAY